MPDHFLDGYLPYLLHRADSLLSVDLHHELAEEHVQVSEWRVLTVLRDRGPLSIGALAERTMLPQPTVTHAVARLERKGYVARSSGRSDRRQRFVSNTEEGAALASTLVERAAALEDAALAELGADERARLVRVLQELIGGLEERPTSPGSHETSS
ncbi:MAG: MarR family transcriptional regulator [Actinomycetota bacterium]|nr:MarR family transcriptional regulator [Actinomycetota bacterium]